MKFRRAQFNLNLLLLVVLTTLCACQSPESKKHHVLASMRFHLEMNNDPTDKTETVSVFREHSIPVHIEKVAFLTEAHIEQATVVDALGGFALTIKFDRQGKWLLEQYSAQYARHRVAIFCQFGEEMKEARWLAAPVMNRRITDGVFTFTPDTTREEAEQIALGLNNVAHKLQDPSSSFD
jgi:preprotein translocase subunit SecD